MKQLIVLFLISIFYFNMLYAQATWIKNIKEYKLVNNFTLDENVNDILYSPKNQEGIRRPSIIIKNSNKKKGKTNDIIFDYKKKTVLNSNKKFNKVIFSENLEYFWNVKRIMSPTQDMTGINLFELFDRNGDKILEKQVVTDYEVGTLGYRILDNGYLLGIDDMVGIIQVYNEKGDFLTERKLITGTGFGRMRGIRYKTTPDCQYIALNVIDTDADNSNFITTMLLDINLNILFQKRLPYSLHRGINISDDGSVIVSSCSGFNSEGITYIFNIANNKITELEGFKINHSTFYENELVMLYSAQSGIRLYYLPEERELFRHSRSIAFAYDYAPEAELVFVLEGRYVGRRANHTKNQLKNIILKVFSLDGTHVYTLNFGKVEYKSRGRCFVSCTNDASKFILKVGDNIYTYEEVK